tara:strand:- start:3 stop:377 length:375 start_codon:yes stop_codon:yes gene_type:complete
MSTIKANTLLAADGTTTTQPSIPALDQRMAKAWVNFDGTGTIAIRDSYNVSSLTDNSTGQYFVNFSNNMSNTVYPVVAGSVVPNYPGTIRVNPDSVTRCRVWTSSSTGSSYQDASVVSVLVFAS